MLFGGTFLFGISTFRRPDEPWTHENGFHYTMIFNTFIFMQVFNEINCRKIGEHDYNVFADFFNNGLFLFIITLTVTVQIALVQYGGEAVRCTPLTGNQHLVCVGIGFFSLVFGYLAKKVPLEYFKGLRLNEEPLQLSEEERVLAYQSSFRKSRSLSRSYTVSRLNASQQRKVQPERTFTSVKKQL